MKNIILLFALTLVSALSAFSQNTVSAADLKMLEGAKWVGELTYLDYSSNKRTSIKSNVTITRFREDENIWIFDFEYPLEPKANGKKEVKLTTSGNEFDGEAVSERTKLADGTLRIVTTSKGKDNDRSATYRKTYLIGKTSFSIKKEVQIDGSTDIFERNTYSWTR